MLNSGKWHWHQLSWLWLASLVIVLDQGSKYSAAQHLLYGQSVSLFPCFNLTLTYNMGAAFSFLSEAGGWQRYFLALIAIFASAIILFWLARLPRQARLQAVALNLILGGALGNLIDRVIHGYVIDFLDFYFKNWHWPAFNLADSAIMLGAFLLIIDVFFFSTDKAH